MIDTSINGAGWYKIKTQHFDLLIPGFRTMVSVLLPAFLSRAQAPIFIAIIVLLVAYYRKRGQRRGLPYPPGPKPWPLVGNLFDIARSNEAAAYQLLAKQYGK